MKVLSHIGAALLVLTVISIGIDLMHKSILLGVIGLLTFPTLTGILLKKLGYDVKTSPLFRETKFVKIAKYILLVFFIIIIILFAIYTYFNLSK